MSILDKVNSPEDVKDLGNAELDGLCEELRDFLVQNVAKTGGHLASNLGVVEITVALHRVFDTSKDRLVFDVGHQSYVHKALTGRKSEFSTLRQFGGLSGFPKPSESIHDAFIAGHASNSISVALGMAQARTLSRGEYSVIALIGDGALTGGLAFEGLSNAGESGEQLIIILNDNGMSIKPNVGGIARYLSRLRMKPSYASFKKGYRRFMEILPGGKYIYNFLHGIKTALKEAILNCSMFEEMGLQYSGPVDGHNVDRIVEALEWAKRQNEPAVIHVLTQKGKGYEFSEKEPDKYHGVRPFDYQKGVASESDRSFSSAFGDELTKIAIHDPRICAITAAMTDGTGLADFALKYPDRFFDVGIAEGHGASMAAGMATRGAVAVFAVYSSFLQRSYDMLLHDIALSNVHVVLAVDRAGLVPGDGETHQGIFDVAYLRSIPDMTILAPSNYAELRDMLRLATDSIIGPVAIRYPRGTEGAYKAGGTQATVRLREGSDFTLVTYGININTAIEAAQILSQEGIEVELIKLGRISPIDIDPIVESVKKTKRLLVLEECVERGSVGEGLVTALAKDFTAYFPKKLILKNTGERFIPCGDVSDLRKLCGIDTESVCASIRDGIRDDMANEMVNEKSKTMNDERSKGIRESRSIRQRNG
ncbi:MAG: 1-deoxy-D-xylulose-5-phosphate synthase [Oscillospiraceae bacterium]|nr:1-deoxy-D-xylulose-5-phosphate synthase [Oscillospiraceae bacterium]